MRFLHSWLYLEAHHVAINCSSFVKLPSQIHSHSNQDGKQKHQEDLKLQQARRANPARINLCGIFSVDHELDHSKDQYEPANN